ncbi:RNA polymerase sigma factor [Sphingomonas sp.]|uniref:RNA polymerase sigma factor n=1 Tax=Sphingomonas sp. TaxID=28214 RepID=UPI003B3AA977
MPTGIETAATRPRTSALRLAWSRLLDQIGRASRRVDAEDLLQDAYVGLLARSAPVRNEEAFLVRAAVNRGRDTWRRERVRGEHGDPALLETLADCAPMPDEAMIMRERLKRVRDGVDRLSPRTREIFLMQRLEGYSYRQIADRLAISPSAVEKHMAKAMTQLAGWMESW